MPFSMGARGRSGWENMHEVEKLTSGRRFAVPCFFTTVPVPSEGVTEDRARGDSV